MSYSNDPVKDADRYYDNLERESELIAREERAVREEIMDTLTKQIRTATNLTVPVVMFTKPLISQVAIADVIKDEIGYGKPFNALMQALQNSDCPLVAEIRKAIAESYADGNALDIAQTRFE